MRAIIEGAEEKKWVAEVENLRGRKAMEVIRRDLVVGETVDFCLCGQWRFDTQSAQVQCITII